MDPYLWLSFAAASLAMALSPGPGVASIVGFAIGSGRRVTLASVLGMAIGNATAMTLSLAGVGALLAASALAFTIVKWAGAAYLIALAVIAIRRTANAAAQVGVKVTARTALFANIGVGTFHPKTILFFVAFAPQFVSPELRYAPQAALMVATFTLIAAVTDAGYALTASRVAVLLRTPRARRWAGRMGGGLLIAAGIGIAARRAG